MTIIEPDPTDWAEWVSYLLKQMEAEAQRRGMGKDFEKMMRLLRKNLDK